MAEASISAAVPDLVIGDCILHPGSHRLLRGTESHHLDPKDMAVLLHLVEAAPDMVSSAELLERNWPGVVVGDNALHQVIGRLRRAFGDQARRPRYIETLARSGYRLLAPVATVGSTTPGATNRHGAGSGSQSATVLLAISILAVVATIGFYVADTFTDQDAAADFRHPAPEGEVVAIANFRDLSADQSLTLLADGIVEDLAHQIDRAQMYDTLPRILLEQDPGLLETAEYAISGTITGSGEHVTVNIALTHVPRKYQLWSQTFEGTSGDPQELRSTIASMAARYFTWSLGAAKWWGPTVLEAYVPFLEYLHLLDGLSDTDLELHWLRRTLDIDPDWAEGWELLSNSMGNLAIFRYDRTPLEAMRQAAEKSRQLARYDQTGWSALGYLQGYWSGDPAATEAVFRAHRLDYYYARLMRDAGLYAEAERYFRYHLESVEPHFLLGWFDLASTLGSQRDINGTIEALRTAIRLAPPDSFTVMWPFTWVLPRTGQLQEAEELIARATNSLTRIRSGSVVFNTSRAFRSVLEFNTALATGDRPRAAAALEDYLHVPHHLSFAGIMMLQLEDPRATDFLRRSGENADFLRFLWGGADPAIPDELREHPEVVRLREALGFTPEWRLELCRRAATFPPDSHIGCSPADYE